MPRQLRIEFENATYHILNRGDRREDIFWNDGDRQLFLDTLVEACAKTHWQIHAYCLMRNHFHLIIETPQPNLVAGMRWFLSTYTARFNRRHNLFGHLFSGRYKSLLVDADHGDYFRIVCNYVHLNPARAGILRLNQPLRDYRWSSFPHYLKRPNQRPKWLHTDRLFSNMDILKDTPAARANFEQATEKYRHTEPSDTYSSIRRGWYYGLKQFRDQVLQRLAKPVTSSHHASERHETDLQRAERIISKELAKISWQETELAHHRKGDPHKIKIAQCLRAQTPLSLSWIATRLGIGTRNHLAFLLYRYQQGNKKSVQ